MPQTDIIERVHARGPNLPTIREDMRWLEMPRDQLRQTLSTSLYPGARPESVDMVLNYCEAAGLNVMLKPVHIVPMSVKDASGQYRMRDVVMPGINHYRTQASRSGTYLGKSEPEFGPMVERQWGQFKLSVPEWCKVTVKRLIGSHIAEFTATEFWDENYASKKRDDPTPNAMWQKRPRGQLHKCTEAQALRMAFPELVGSETAEEMEGKAIEAVAEVLAEATPRAATQSLDQFSGADDKPAERKAEPETNAKAEPDANLSDECPDMPADMAQPFYNPTGDAEPDWKPGWKWLNETMPGLTGAARQQLTNDHAALLWAVYNSDAKAKKGGGPQAKAAREFAERMGVVVPKVKGQNDGEK